MKKRHLKFLRYLELETSVSFDYEQTTTINKCTDSGNNPCQYFGIMIDSEPILLTIVSSKCQDKEIVKGLILFCFEDEEFGDVRDIRRKIQSAIPSIPVLFCDSVFDMNTRYISRLCADNF